MKFSAVLQDVTAIETFIKFLNAVCRLGKKKCCMKMQSDGLSFISCANIHDGGVWFCLFLPYSSQLFRRFDVIGMNPRNPEQNFIYLEIDIDNLVRILPGGHCYLKLRLSKSPADEAVMAVEVRNPDSDIVSHQLPIKIILTKFWKTYSRPSIGCEKISIYLPPPRIISRLIQSCRNLNGKVVKFTSSSNGDLRISSMIEHGEIDAVFSDLATNFEESDSQEETSSVQLTIKTILTMFQSFSFSRANVKMSIISNRMAEFSMNCEDCSLSYIVGNVAD